MISFSDGSKVTKTLPVENLNKKVLSECNQYLGDRVCFDSAKNENFHSSNYSSSSAKERGPTNAFTFSMTLSSLGSPPPLDKPLFFGTPDKCEGKTNSEISAPATSSIDYSVVTPADFGITPESFTKQGKAKSIEKLRRQSTIGIRGSPENNSLIRYIAYRKRMRTENPILQTSPFQRSAFLKNKIAAFQSSFKPLEEAAEPKIHTPYSCIQSENSNEELSSSTTSQQSCKRVRFAEKQSLEIFDEAKIPITPLQKGHFPSAYHDSSCLHSVLKKTPVRMSAEDTKEHLDNTSTRKGSEEQSDFQSCGPLQTGKSTRQIDKMEANSKEGDVKGCDEFQCVNTPGHSGEASFSPSRTRSHSSFNTTPLKLFSQPNFDSDDGLLQDTSEVVSSIESVVKSGAMEDKETKVCSSDLHTTCVRLTRSSAKKVNKIEESHTNLTKEMRPKRTCTTSKVPNRRQFQSENSVTKSAAKKPPVCRRKAFGKRKRKKKTQKVFHGHYETVSKKPLLSPIPEITESISFISSYQSTPELSVSILDRSCSSFVQETLDETNSPEEGDDCLHPNLSGMKGDVLPGTVSCSFLQLQDAIPSDSPITFPLAPPDKDSSRDLKNILNGQVFKSSYSSRSEMELGLLNLQGTDEKYSKEASLHIGDSVVEQPSGSDICVNFKRFPRRSKKFAPCLPSVGDFQPATPRNNPSVPTDSMEELPCTPETVNNSRLFKDVLYAIEDSFRSITSSTQKRVRRSMRKIKNAEGEGLQWISVPSNDYVNQAPVGSDCKTRRKSCAFCLPESGMLHQNQNFFVQAPSPMMEDQKSAPAGVEHCRPRKKRKSIYSQGDS